MRVAASAPFPYWSDPARLPSAAGCRALWAIGTSRSLPTGPRAESNATCGKRLDSIGVANTEDNRRAYRELLLTTPELGKYISGAILFEETLYQSTKAGKTFVDVMKEQNIVPGIKVDKVRRGAGPPSLPRTSACCV